MKNFAVLVFTGCLMVASADRAMASRPADQLVEPGCPGEAPPMLVVPGINLCDDPNPAVLRVQMKMSINLFNQAMDRLPDGWLMHHFDLECTKLLFHLGRLKDDMIQPIIVSYDLTGQETEAELETAAKAIIDDLISGRALRLHEEAKSKADSI